jgi:hypothetical protein
METKSAIMHGRQWTVARELIEGGPDERKIGVHMRVAGMYLELKKKHTPESIQVKVQCVDCWQLTSVNAT